MYPSSDYRAYKKEIIPYLKKLVKEYEWDIAPTEHKHYFIDAVIYFPRTDKDPSNYWKCLLDVGNEILYVDDRTIVPRVQRVYYTYSDEVEPHIELKLYPAPYIGIFDSEEEAEAFAEKCKTCRYYLKGRCNRLRDFMDYKITNDFDWEKRECKGYVKRKEKKKKKPKKKVKA